MEFSVAKSLEIVERTPDVLHKLLNNLSSDWIDVNEGENTWTVREILTHLILCEETDWLPRIKIVLHEPETVFPPIDMQGHFGIAAKHDIKTLLIIFKNHREMSVHELKSLQLTPHQLNKTGIHPNCGEVSIRQIIATWVAHDLSHIAQMARVMAKQNREEVGKFKQYLKLLNT
jgi:hypothetical protein